MTKAGITCLAFLLAAPGAAQTYHPAPYSPAFLNPLCGAMQIYACDMDRNPSSPGFGKAYLVGANASSNLPTPKFQILIAAFDAPGNLSWWETYGSSGQARAAAVDSQGALVIATTTSVLRLPIGNPWSSYALSGVIPQRIAFDAADNVYVTGYTGTSQQVYTVRLDKTPSGGLALSPGWPRTFGSSGGKNEGRAIAVKDAVYVAGTGYRASTGQDALVLKYPLTGGTPTEFWYDGFLGDDGLNDLVVDASGNVFATGYSANDFETIPGDGDTLTLRLSSASFGTAAWIARYDAGRLRVGGQIYSSIDTASFLALDPTGQSVFVAGSSVILHSDILALKYNAANGAQLAKTQFDGGSTADSPAGLFVSAAGQVFVGGVSGSRYVQLAWSGDLSSALYGTPSYLNSSTSPTAACMVGRSTTGAPALFSGGVSRLASPPACDPAAATGIQWIYP